MLKSIGYILDIIDCKTNFRRVWIISMVLNQIEDLWSGH